MLYSPSEKEYWIKEVETGSLKNKTCIFTFSPLENQISINNGKLPSTSFLLLHAFIGNIENTCVKFKNLP